MAVHGMFATNHGKKPTIWATILHPKIKVQISMPFIVDTGADSTLIVPYYESILGVAQRSMKHGDVPFETIGGDIYLAVLGGCTIYISGIGHEGGYSVNPVPVKFFSKKLMKRHGRNIPLAGDANYPNILGRDVFDYVSLGYCQSSLCLFVTEETTRYRSALDPHFPRPIDEERVQWV